MAASILVAGGGIGLYRVAYQSGRSDGEAKAVHLEAAIGNALARGDAEIWLALMRNNDRISSAPRTCAPLDGRLACQFELWGGPAPPPPKSNAGRVHTTAEGKEMIQAYAGHYAHHASGGLDWVLNAVMHAVMFSTVSRLPRHMTLPEVDCSGDRGCRVLGLPGTARLTGKRAAITGRPLRLAS